MTLHWDKTQALAVCSETALRDPDGNPLEDSGSLVCLGGLLTADGRADSEVSRRIGAAMGACRALRRFGVILGLAKSANFNCSLLGFDRSGNIVPARFG